MTWSFSPQGYPGSLRSYPVVATPAGLGATLPSSRFSKTVPPVTKGATEKTPEQLAQALVDAVQGLGRNQRQMEQTLQFIGKHQMQQEVDASLRKLRPNVYNAMDLVHREVNNPLEKFFFAAAKRRAWDLYTKGEDSFASSDNEYRREGIAAIPMGLFQTFKEHPLATAAIFSGIAMTASFTPFGAAKLSNAITLLSMGGAAANEFQAHRHAKGSKERAEHLKQAGENWIGIGINVLPMPEVVTHLKGGVSAIKQGYKGAAHAAHAALDASDEAAKASNFLQGAAAYAKEVAESIPAFVNTNLGMVGDTLRYATLMPGKIAQKGLPTELHHFGRALKSGFGHESNFADVQTKLGAAVKTGQPLEVLKTLQQALTAQIPLAATLVDEITFPFVKAVQAMQAGKGAATGIEKPA
jgi:hypothetical protein